MLVPLLFLRRKMLNKRDRQNIVNILVTIIVVLLAYWFWGPEPVPQKRQTAPITAPITHPLV